MCELPPRPASLFAYHALIRRRYVVEAIKKHMVDENVSGRDSR